MARMEGWYWCRLREKNPWAIFRWSGSNWWSGEEALAHPPAIIDTECLHEPIADDDPLMIAAGERAMSMYAHASVCREIQEIMQTYREQEAKNGYVDTPGGLEHMGDVWGLLSRWDRELRDSR
jgi:hypothetical protein